MKLPSRTLLHGGGSKLMDVTWSRVFKECVKLQWSGDVDLNDGQLQKQYEEYVSHLESVKKAGLVQEHASDELTCVLEDTTTV